MNRMKKAVHDIFVAELTVGDVIEIMQDPGREEYRVIDNLFPSATIPAAAICRSISVAAGGNDDGGLLLLLSLPLTQAAEVIAAVEEVNSVLKKSLAEISAVNEDPEDVGQTKN